MPNYLIVPSQDVTGGRITSLANARHTSDLALTVGQLANGVPVTVFAAAEVASGTPAPAASARPVSTNIDSITNDATAQQFLDRVKMTGMSILSNTGETPLLVGGADGAADAFVDANGWLETIPPGYAEARILWAWAGMDPAYNQVPHVLTWDGADGTVTLTNADNVTPDPGAPRRVTFTPRMTNNWWLTIAPTGPDYPRNIRVFRAQDEALLDAGHIWNPDYLAYLQGISEVRVMDLQRTNSPLSGQGMLAPATWHGYGSTPVGPELLADLANRIGADLWVCMHHLSPDAEWSAFAARLAAALDAARSVKVAYSNEVWNFNLAPAPDGQYFWVGDQAAALWGDGTDLGRDSYVAMKTVDALAAFQPHFPRNRIRLVMETQATNTSVTTRRLDPTVWAVNGPNYVDPTTVVDELAITTYLGPEVIPNDQFRAEIIAQIGARSQQSAFDWFTSYLLGNSSWATNSFERMTGFFTSQKALADAAGVDLSLYEGGQHLIHAYSVTPADRAIVNPFLVDYLDSPQMAALYYLTAERWAQISSSPLMQFGILRNSGDGFAGKWALVEQHGEPLTPRAELVLETWAQGLPPSTDYAALLVPLTPVYQTLDVRAVSATTDGIALTIDGQPVTNPRIDDAGGTGAIIVGGELRNAVVDGFQGRSGELVFIATDQGYIVGSLLAAPAGDYVQTWLATSGGAQAGRNSDYLPEAALSPAAAVSFWASYQSQPNFSRFFDAGGIVLTWSGARMALTIYDSANSIVGAFTAALDEPLNDRAHHFISADLAAPALVWTRNGQPVTYTTQTPLQAGTGLANTSRALRLFGQEQTAQEFADMATYYGAAPTAAAAWNGGAAYDLRAGDALPRYLIGYPIQADQSALGDPAGGLNDGANAGSSGPFERITGTFTDIT